MYICSVAQNNVVLGTVFSCFANSQDSISYVIYIIVSVMCMKFSELMSVVLCMSILGQALCVFSYCVHYWTVSCDLLGLYFIFISYFSLRYDMIRYIYVRSKADKRPG